jgi:hypothetical protein
MDKITTVMKVVIFVHFGTSLLSPSSVTTTAPVVGRDALLSNIPP